MRALIDTNTGFTGNEVARVSGMNPRSAFKALTLLENLGIVNRQIGGRDHIFTLNREHYLVREAILKVYQTEYKFRDEIFKELESILKKRVYSAVIFGSTARKEETALSDLDICCIVDNQTDQTFVRDALNKKSQMLYKKFGIKLAPIFFMKQQFIKKSKSRLIRSITDEGILITGKSPKGLLND
jgi:predicted nucleotidyltransferase